MEETALSNPPPPKPAEERAPVAASWDTHLRTATARADDKGSVFGAKAVKKDKVWVEPDELTSVRANANHIASIEKEFCAFGGLKVLDVSLSSNSLEARMTTLAVPE